MAPEYYLVKKENGLLLREAKLVDSAAIQILDDPIRKRILQKLYTEPAYPAEIAREFQLHEQKVYYHIKQLLNAGLISVVERKEIRGTTAKKFGAPFQTFAFSLESEWGSAKDLGTMDSPGNLSLFLDPFVRNGKFNAEVIVGSPDPHGPFKARARDSHYAIHLALFLGKFCSTIDKFSVRLDVDVNLSQFKSNLILVGGPVTNLLVSKLNENMNISFKGKENWVIAGKKQSYSDDSIGMIAKFPNPYDKRFSVLLLSGIRFIGTKAAVIALTNNFDHLLKEYSGEKEFYAIVQGFDLDGDGKIDATEVLESGKNVL